MSLSTDPSSLENLTPSLESAPVDEHGDDESYEGNLSDRAQQIVNNLNAKRERDAKLLSEFKASLQAQVEKTCSLLEQHMYRTYDKKGVVFNRKLQELFSCLERVSTLKMELQDFKQDLKTFFQEME
ncbi:hypothetical protein BaRGS_00020260 [Batillaria attramentaria]|uniref:Biogenesis of lysosome-related organelles complex 1 subunit KXD1 n=1 Tax=Batillaria attramentaria TaxID=370345 RepID=A0ABD0KMM9_9CAEN